MAITFINSTGLGISVAASTWSIPTHSSILGGAAFVVGLGPNSSAVTVSTITDNAGNTYLKAVARGTPRPAAGSELWYATGISSVSTRVSVTLSASAAGSIGIAQFSGFSTANALVGTASSAVTANSTLHGAAALTPPTANCALVSFGGVTASTIGAFTTGATLTAWLSTSAAGGLRCFGQYVIQGAAATSSGDFRTSSQCMHSAAIAAFSDTNTVVPVLGCPCFTLLGVQ